jgi:AAA+ ATPase superfamily predicted ATPase
VAVVLDELPYLADAELGLLTVLQHWWDAHKRRPNLKLFLAGSYVSFMERQVLDVSAPLYNRRTAAMRLEPMNYADAALFFPRYTAHEKMEAYAILGGMPSYLEQFDPEKGIEENLLATALRRNTYLSEEPDWLLLEDLRRDVTYGSILRAVASGERRPSDIARAIGKESAQSVAPQLETLRDLGLLAREVPVTEKRRARSRNSLYFLADHYLNFWYRYVDPSRSLVAQGLGRRVWERSIAPTLPAFVSRPAFECACRQYLWRALVANRLPPELAFVDVGTWWGAGDREIDVIALDERGRAILAGSCKWTNEPMDVADYAALQRDVAMAAADLNPVEGEGPWLALFSREGFTERLRALAAAQQPCRLLLVDLEAMYSV